MIEITSLIDGLIQLSSPTGFPSSPSPSLSPTPIDRQGDAVAAGVFFALFCCFGVFGLLLLGFWIWMLVDCLTRNFPGDNDKVVWVLVIIFANWVGAIIYFFVGRPKGTRGSSTPPGKSPPGPG